MSRLVVLDVAVLPRDIWQCLETFLVVISVVLVGDRVRKDSWPPEAKDAVNSLQFTGQPPHKGLSSPKCQ